MKNMLVTGGCGFIGANFIRYLLKESDYTGRIINVDNLTYAGNLENLAGIEIDYPEQYIFIKADICDRNLIMKIFVFYGNNTLQTQQSVFCFQGIFGSSGACIPQDLRPTDDHIKLF
jgi:dTDP-glucose 4,6-dehydratase